MEFRRFSGYGVVELFEESITNVNVHLSVPRQVSTKSFHFSCCLFEEGIIQLKMSKFPVNDVRWVATTLNKAFSY